jgi:prepilin-type N-terminal cleavage/methylation domain-containing protein
MKILRKWFTLVELIVVITILAILWTIAFISLQWYAKDARDSVRVQDFANIKKSLELFVTEKWFYPIPSGATDMTYSGGVVWQQWTFWDSVVENLWQLNKKPVDPLLETEYSYSLTNAKTEYELWWVVEWWWAFSSLPFTNQASAATNYMALVGGSYNGKVLQVSTWGLDYLLALPSITTTDIATTDVITTTTNKGLVYNWEANLPSNYSSIEWFTTTWWFEYDPSSLVVFEGTKADLWYTAGKVEFIENLQNAYSGTLLSFKAEFNDLLSFDAITNRDTAKNFALNIFETVPQFSWDLKTSSFEPTDVSNLKLWLDADDLYTITKDGSNLVSQWNDNRINFYLLQIN